MKFENTVTGIKYNLFMGISSYLITIYISNLNLISKKRIYNHSIDIKTFIQI